MIAKPRECARDVTAGQHSNVKLALCTIAFREKLLEYALDVASELGVDGVEIWGREPHISEKFDENRVRATRKKVASRGLHIPVLGSYSQFGITHPRLDEAVEIETTLHTARCLGAPLVRVWASDVPSSEASAALWARTVREIQQACEQAAKLGITLAAEMHDHTLADTGPSARQLVEAVGHENFRLNFQVAAYPHSDAPEERLEAVLPYVVHMHAQNYARLLKGEDDPLQRAPLDNGVIDYENLVGQLMQSGYNGYIALEFAYAEGKDKEPALRDDLTYLKTLTGAARQKHDK